MSKLFAPVTPHDHIQGDPQAPCILVEYGDYQCPSCGEVEPIIKNLQKHFGSKLAFVFRNFPLTEIHPHAEPAAEVAEFAAAHNKFWEMHDLLFANQEQLGSATFRTLAKKLNLPEPELESAVSTHAYKTRIQADLDSGDRSGVHGTPTFFINGAKFTGGDLDSMKQAIQKFTR